MNLRTWLPPLALLGLGTTLFFVDRSLESRDVARRDMRDRIGRLIRAEERATIPVSAITIEIGEREKFRFVKFEDRWRIDDPSGAAAATETLVSLYESFLEGEGIVRSTDPNRLADYGFANKDVIRVLLHGPDVMKKKDRDVRYRCELGKSIPEINGGFVRRDGSSHVWSLDRDPRSIIEKSRRGTLPPMLETTLISRVWLGASGQLGELRIEVPGAAPVSMKLEQLPIQEEEMRQGKDPFRWTVTQGGSPLTIDNRTVMSFYSFLLSANYDGLYDQKAATELGLVGEQATPATRIVFVPQSGKSCELRLAAPRTDGRRALFNTESRICVDLSAEVASLVQPKLEQFALPAQESPWQKYMLAQQAATQELPSLEMPPISK